MKFRNVDLFKCGVERNFGINGMLEIDGSWKSSRNEPWLCCKLFSWLNWCWWSFIDGIVVVRIREEPNEQWEIRMIELLEFGKKNRLDKFVNS